MTDQNAATPAVDPNAPVVTPQVVYLKDCSFESPNGPFVGGLEGQPAVNLNISTRATAIAQDLHEVVVQVHLEAKAGDKVVWLLELQQAGAFLVRNLVATDVAQVVVPLEGQRAGDAPVTFYSVTLSATGQVGPPVSASAGEGLLRRRLSRMPMWPVPAMGT